MTVQSVIQEVTAFIGVRPPNGTVFVSPYLDRTSWEFVNLANEMAQRIAYDWREWQVMRALNVFAGDGSKTSFPLPADYNRMLKTAQVWRSSNTTAPMTFISDADDWLRKELQGYTVPIGEWCIFNNEMHIRPTLSATETAKFFYLKNTCVKLTSGGFGDRFLQDTDTFILPERLLKLGMIWQWKAYKGATYAEDIANYEDALSTLAGSDKPSPILIGSQTISSDAMVAYWGPTPPPGTFVGPGP